MTNILVIGDIVCIETGYDIVIGFAPDDKVILDIAGLSDEQYFDIIGNYDDSDNIITWHSDGKER